MAEVGPKGEALLCWLKSTEKGACGGMEGSKAVKYGVGVR